jgi:hypothetical protein
MDADESEACGRCAMSSAVDVAGFDKDKNRNRDRDRESDSTDPFAGERIEVPESEMRRAAAPAVLAGRLKRKLDEIATRLTYGR